MWRKAMWNDGLGDISGDLDPLELRFALLGGGDGDGGDSGGESDPGDDPGTEAGSSIGGSPSVGTADAGDADSGVGGGGAGGDAGGAESLSLGDISGMASETTGTSIGDVGSLGGLTGIANALAEPTSFFGMMSPSKYAATPSFNPYGGNPNQGFAAPGPNDDPNAAMAAALGITGNVGDPSGLGSGGADGFDDFTGAGLLRLATAAPQASYTPPGSGLLSQPQYQFLENRWDGNRFIIPALTPIV